MSNYIMQPYDDALQYVLDHGERKSNRTGVNTLSVFGYQMRFNISDRFPILTKRKMYYKSIFAELLWMLSGSTNVNDLEAMGSKIWTAWRDKEFEKRNGYVDGEFGPIYGFQMRHFGGNYPMKDLLDHNGFDQIQYLVDELRNNPTSRRMVMNLWNPNDMCQVNVGNEVRLPCCHYSFILNVSNGKLNGMLVQRSADLPCGSPANIQFYSALIYMLAQQSNLSPGELVYSIADAHIYIDQIPMVKEYLSRPKVDSPKLELANTDSIFNYKLENFNITDYSPLSVIKFPVAV